MADYSAFKADLKDVHHPCMEDACTSALGLRTELADPASKGPPGKRLTLAGLSANYLGWRGLLARQNQMPRPKVDSSDSSDRVKCCAIKQRAFGEFYDSTRSNLRS
jgi:hypothetical protein